MTIPGSTPIEDGEIAKFSRGGTTEEPLSSTNEEDKDDAGCTPWNPTRGKYVSNNYSSFKTPLEPKRDKGRSSRPNKRSHIGDSHSEDDVDSDTSYEKFLPSVERKKRSLIGTPGSKW